MKNKTFLIIVVYTLLLWLILPGSLSLAQSLPGMPEQTTQEKVSEETQPEYLKVPVKINDKLLLYIGETGQISAKQRALEIIYQITKTSKEAFKYSDEPLKIGIIQKGENYYIEIAEKKVIEITDIDAQVNKQDKDKLAQIWKSNIISLLENDKSLRRSITNEKLWYHLGITLVILVIFISLLSFIRSKIKHLIVIFAKSIFYTIGSILNKLKIPEKEELPNEKLLESKDSEDNSLEKDNSTDEIEDSPEMEDKISLISDEINTIITYFITSVQVIAFLAYINYVLYLLPKTHDYVAGFTHLLLSITLVLKDNLEIWVFSSNTWETAGRIILISVITAILLYTIRIIGTAIENIIQLILEEDKARAKRMQTITKIIRTTIKILLVILTVIIILSEIGVNIAPFIAGAGILGLAISFGSQSLVKDIINGVFILIENQFGIGDVVSISGIGGVVEDMTLRVTILRDLSGKAYVIPNGQITTVVVMTKGWARAHLDIGIAYKEDIDTASSIIMDVATGMQNEFPEKITDTPEILGVNALNDSSVDIKLIMKTAPGDQWFIEREFRRRIKYAFDEKNIEIPFPHTTLYVPQPVGYEANQQS